MQREPVLRSARNGTAEFRSEQWQCESKKCESKKCESKQCESKQCEGTSMTQPNAVSSDGRPSDAVFSGAGR